MGCGHHSPVPVDVVHTTAGTNTATARPVGAGGYWSTARCTTPGLRIEAVRSFEADADPVHRSSADLWTAEAGRSAALEGVGRMVCVSAVRGVVDRTEYATANQEVPGMKAGSAGHREHCALGPLGCAAAARAAGRTSGRVVVQPCWSVAVAATGRSWSLMMVFGKTRAAPCQCMLQWHRCWSSRSFAMSSKACLQTCSPCLP